MAGSKKIEIYKWIYEYFYECGVPEDCPFQLSDILDRLTMDISMIERKKLNTKPRTIADSLRQEILKTMREMKAFDEKSAVSVTEIRNYNELLASQRQISGVTNLLKALVSNNIVTKIPRPDPKTHVKYYINKEYWSE